MPLLSVLLWLPVLGGAFLLMTGSDRRAGYVRWGALAISLATFLFSLPLWTGFDTGRGGMQFVEELPWITAFDIRYSLGVDGIAMPLILLTTFCTVLVVIAGWEVIDRRVASYMGAFLILEGLMNGVFAARDAFLFYVLWEAQLIPMFLIIGIWGGPRRIYATIKFFLYTFLGSVFMLVALLYLQQKAGSFQIEQMYGIGLPLDVQKIIFLAFLVAFAVKIPMWPVHTWLPDAHVEAPTGGSVILAAIMLKMGGYGFLRFSLPITPEGSHALSEFMIVLSLVAVVYIGFVALVQKDMKKLIAYSSIAHMGFVTLGTFAVFRIMDNGFGAGATMAVSGAMVQMISHGLVSAALFLCVGVLYDRMHSREIADYGGVVNTMPVFAAFMMLFAMANSGLPGTSGFVGEFMVILASMRAGFWIALLAATTMVLGAAFTLWMYKRVIFGEVANEKVAALKDLNRRELVFLTALAVPVLLLGVWPAPLLEVINPAVDLLLQQIAPHKTALVMLP
ncbi:MAG: NADH-quinone oxidoreductase subunit M [Gammaproteobacteria bacterium]|nr:MAG: NADH-quinone oxidoreductase subunit M [Gammaproteobacteria bacterium]